MIVVLSVDGIETSGKVERKVNNERPVTSGLWMIFMCTGSSLCGLELLQCSLDESFNSWIL